MIWAAAEWLLFPLGVILFMAAIEGGFRLGIRYKSGNDDMASHITALQAAILGLLALLLGFTFAMSVSRFDARKDLVVEESNAITTTWLRAGFLPQAQQHQIRDLLKSYVDARLEYYDDQNDPQRLKAEDAKAVRIQRQLWPYAIAAPELVKVPVTASLFAQSVNALIEVKEKRRVAMENHVPATVFALLFLVASAGMIFIGYVFGLTGRRRHGATTLFAVLIALVQIVILDIDRPRNGMILVSEASLERLQTALSHGDPLMPESE